MSMRPDLDRNLSGEAFKSYYYLREELMAFCKQEGLQATGGKLELTNRIAHYLDTGEKLTSASKSKASKDIDAIYPDSIIEVTSYAPKSAALSLSRPSTRASLLMLCFKKG